MQKKMFPQQGLLLIARPMKLRSYADKVQWIQLGTGVLQLVCRSSKAYTFIAYLYLKKTAFCFFNVFRLKGKKNQV